MMKREDTLSASIEELPEEDLQNNLLTVIKILKRTRDVFYYRRNSENKPSSIIITTLIGKLAPDLKPTVNKLDLLIQVVTQLQQIKTYPSNSLSKRTDDTGYAISNIITRNMGEWVLNNPANGKDNILSSWNEDKDKEKDFFLWIDNLNETFSLLVENDNEEESIAELYSAFAIDFPTSSTSKKQFSVTQDSSKPWCEK
ncbi:hypothetical protein ET007_05785 [Lactococcus garvieae]|nr:hypothetical protein [Lactococcus garvieae]